MSASAARATSLREEVPRWADGCAALSWRGCLGFTLGWQAAGFALLAGQLVLVCALGAPAIAVGLLGAGVLFAYRPLSGLTLYLQLLLYQNVFLSSFSGWGIDPAGFTAVQGLSFGVLGGMALGAAWSLLGGRRAPLALRRPAIWICASLAVVAAYTGFGMLGAPPASALIYLRSTSGLLLALLVGLAVGRRWHFATVAAIFLLSLPFGLALAMAEYTVPHAYYTAIDAGDYIRFRGGDGELPAIARSVDDLVAGRVVRWFNITAGGTDMLSVRIFGPNMLAVSYAYVLAIGGIAGVALGVPAIGAVAVGLLVVAGVKGPLLLLLLTLLLRFVWRVARGGRAFLLAGLALIAGYVAQGLRVGLANGDFHVIGFLGGINGLLRMPWGHGIGVGGNLSATAAANLDWQAFQQSGADFALESAVGVLLYQLGAASIVVYAPVVGLLRRSWRQLRAGTSRQPGAVATVMIGIAVTLANGIFQEEAYSTYALGLLTLLGGVLAGNAATREPGR